MTPSRTYATAGAFRSALEERLKGISQAEQVDLNRLRRQVSFDRLLARLFRDETTPRVLKGGYALELRFKSARSTIDIDLTVQRVTESSEGNESATQVREILQASVSLDDWFEFIIGPPMMDLTAAPYGGARNSIEARMSAPAIIENGRRSSADFCRFPDDRYAARKRPARSGCVNGFLVQGCRHAARLPRWSVVLFKPCSRRECNGERFPGERVGLDHRAPVATYR